MEELLELCSGRFTNQNTQQTFKSAFNKVKEAAHKESTIPDDNDDTTDNLTESSEDDAYDTDLQDEFDIGEANDQEIDKSKRYNMLHVHLVILM